MESQAIGATERTQQDILEQQEALDYLRRIARILENQATADSAQRQRIVVDTLPSVVIGSGTVTTVSTVTTMANQTNLDGYRGYEMFAFNARLAYNTGIRANLV